VVSLVPWLTEAVARSAPGRLVGATDWCTHPAGLAVTRVRGTKNPERARIAALAPDLVIANREENRKLEEIRAAAPEVVLLPDEPYPFTAEDGPEEFPAQRVVLASGRLLTWYGPSLATARADLLGVIG
jgi:ABC-type Fe3+-hydroxamate transport system substrate-binding protein